MNRAARKRPHRVLLEEDITSMLQDDDDSEDGLDFDDDSLADPDFSPELETFEDNTSILDIDVDSIIETLESNHESSVPSPPSAETASHGPLPSSAQSNQSNKTATKPTKLNLRWKKKSLQVNSEQLRFKGNMNLGTELLELETPIQFFFYLFPQELIKMISEETNLYQVQNDPNSTFRVTEMDIRQFMGVVYLMSLIRLPRVTNHWNPILGTPIIQDTMPLNKFEKVRQTLHFNDNSKNLPRNDPGYDRIFKIRPVVESLNAAHKKVPLEEHLFPTAKKLWKNLRDNHRHSLNKVKSSRSGQAVSTENTWKYAQLMEFLLPHMKNRPTSGNYKQSTGLPNTESSSNRQTSENRSIIDLNADDSTQSSNENINNLGSDSNQNINVEQDANVSRTKRKSQVDDYDIQSVIDDIDKSYKERTEERNKRRQAELEKEKDKHPLNLFFESMCETTKRLPEWLQRSIKKQIFNIVLQAEDTYENCQLRDEHYPHYSSLEHIPQNIQPHTSQNAPQECIPQNIQPHTSQNAPQEYIPQNIQPHTSQNAPQECIPQNIQPHTSQNAPQEYIPQNIQPHTSQNAPQEYIPQNIQPHTSQNAPQEYIPQNIQPHTSQNAPQEYIPQNTL
ncbi:hypothetical protein HF086_008632 [Spodoptera exigua]|uniref:PiggyBac transposable element-derived protein domain-containing protein n=1 Tax=Spodoptera exigua TaxID=7107 RepID=A0A922M1Q5_SPOEX|nr:hypothetical protein HF086_008632 [Spodoptera exigua]